MSLEQSHRFFLTWTVKVQVITPLSTSGFGFGALSLTGGEDVQGDKRSGKLSVQVVEEIRVGR